jgi:uncharacterized protein (TIGR02145 family)
MKKAFLILSALLLSFSFQSCKKSSSTPPHVTTNNISQISFTTALSGGSISDNGGSEILLCGICLGQDPDPVISGTKFTGTLTGGSFIVNLTGLLSNTKYYMRAFATNKVGIGYGNQVIFTTLEAKIPLLTTMEVSSVGQKSAQSGGTVSDARGSAVISHGVCWGTSHLPTIEDSKTDEGAGSGEFHSTITGLHAGTVYYVRAYATNSLGTGYGDELDFTTSPPSLPVLTTVSASSLKRTSAVSGGSITDNGGLDITAQGLCWSTTPNPTTENNKSIDESGYGHFTIKITGLSENTTYYLRAYATNSVGTSYGNEVIFTTLSGPVFNPNISYGSVTDIDGNVYKTIIINDKEWMAENLKVSKYNDGTLNYAGTILMHIKDAGNWNLATPGYCWYGDDSLNYDIYGALYNWYAVSSGKLCPSGWHVPAVSEWTSMINALGGQTQAGGSLKEAGNAHWITPNTGATNSSGFTALPGGVEDPYSYISSGISKYANFWTSSQYYDDDRWGWNVSMGFDNVECHVSWPSKQYGFSVRCVKD